MRSLFMVLVLIFALGLVFSPIALIALAEREKTKEVKKEAAKTACVDARKCFGYNKIMYGVISTKKVLDGQKDVIRKVCIVKEDDEKRSVWSFEQSRCAIVSEINEDSRPLKKVVENESTEEQATKETSSVAKPEKTKAAPKKISGLIAGIEEERAATKEEIAAEEELMLEITGLIIEETMTRIGYEFYEYFFLFWEAPEVEVKDYNILISEKASPIWGSWVKVNIDDTTVWSKVIRPRSEEIEDAVKQAIEATKQYLYNYEQYQFQTEDMVGTGI